LQSIHPHTKVTLKSLQEISGAGRDATRKLFHELEVSGYIDRKNVHIGQGRFDWIIRVYASPDLNPAKNPTNDRLRKNRTGQNSANPSNPRVTDSPHTVDQLPADRIAVDRPPADRLPVKGQLKDLKNEDLNTEELKNEEIEDQRREIDWEMEQFALGEIEREMEQTRAATPDLNPRKSRKANAA